MICILAGCTVLRQQRTTDSFVATTSVSDKAHFESLYYELRDSVANIKAPVEKSESKGLLRSFLETSLAWSSANIDSLGSLHHTIANKDSIPSKIVYRDIRSTIRDTMYIYHSDTVSVKEYVQIEREPGFWQKFQMRGFWLLLTVVVVYALAVAARFYLKRVLSCK